MRPIFPIFPSYNNDEVDLKTTQKYIDYLLDNKVDSIMSTAGSSQFNLMTNDEIRDFNKMIINSDNKSEKIIGLNYGSSSNIKKEIDWLDRNTQNNNYKIMILYPERYYKNESLIDFFYDIANYSNNEIWIHGMYIRRGNGGIYDYDSNLINELSLHKNITGMKEETSDINTAFSTVNKINKNFDVCVAGGSMKRHLFLSTEREVNFLSGIGSLWPEIEIEYSKSNLSKKRNIIKEYENPLFEVFMRIGWHASIRYSLKKMGYISDNRKPFVELSDDQKKQIDLIIEEIKQKI